MPRKGTSPIKQIFVPRFDFILNADLSQLEWRVVAFLSQDPVMMREIREGIDAHADNAERIFGVGPNDPKFKETRQTAKIFTFRMIYGGSAYSFYMDHNMPNFSLPKWERIVKAFYKKYTGLKRWQDKCIAHVYKHGKLVNPTGRILTFRKQNLGRKGIGYREQQIKNFPVQSLATADIMPLAMVHIYKRIKRAKLRSLIIGQVHDSLVFDVPKEEMETVARICMDVFNSLPKLIEAMWGFEFNVPLTGECEFGNTYGQLKELPL